MNIFGCVFNHLLNITFCWLPPESFPTSWSSDGVFICNLFLNSEADFFSSDLDGLEKKFNTGGADVKKVPAILKCGQVTFHHCRTIHGSGPNTTEQPRRSIALHLQPASNRYQAAYQDDHLISHPNDDLTRLSNGKPNYSDPIYCPVIGEIKQAEKALKNKT